MLESSSAKSSDTRWDFSMYEISEAFRDWMPLPEISALFTFSW